MRCLSEGGKQRLVNTLGGNGENLNVFFSFSLGPTQNHSLTERGDQKDQAERITLWEYLRRAAEKSLRQAAEEERQQSPFRDCKLAIPLPGTGPLRCQSSPPPQSKPAPVSSLSHHPSHHRRHPSTSAAASATTKVPVGFFSRPGRRRCRSSVPLREPDLAFWCLQAREGGLVWVTRADRGICTCNPSSGESTSSCMGAVRYINSRCLETAEHLANNPQDYESVLLA
ncbi:hypothetical protein ILYODFUR_009694 [Ilyodon furcidens]|uniref:Uncharacterized protein n=1 Tax=Ilyodon furcidens TaxID=33524 RepID=A0ABV0UGK7_9TELE